MNYELLDLKVLDNYCIETIRYNGTIIIYNDELKRKYIGYTTKEAIEMFKTALKNQKER